MTIKFPNDGHDRLSTTCSYVCYSGGQGSDSVDCSGRSISSKGVSSYHSYLGLVFECEVEGDKLRCPFIPYFFRGRFAIPNTVNPLGRSS